MFRLIIVCVLLGVVATHSTFLQPNVSITNRNLGIVGGNLTDIALHPWQVSVQYFGYHFCGGFLISANWVVTAAHCLVLGYNSNLNIRAGSSSTATGGQSVLVQSTIVHPSFSTYTLDSDIALLYLASSVNTANARAAVLPTAGQTIANGASVSVTGWGALWEGGPGTSQLQEVIVPAVNPQTCRQIYGITYTNNMFCAGFLNQGGKDACQGDSGGPAVVNGQVVGIVSYGYGCARPEYPGVYASVASLRSWITQHTGI